MIELKEPISPQTNLHPYIHKTKVKQIIQKKRMLQQLEKCHIFENISYVIILDTQNT